MHSKPARSPVSYSSFALKADTGMRLGRKALWVNTASANTPVPGCAALTSRRAAGPLVHLCVSTFGLGVIAAGLCKEKKKKPCLIGRWLPAWCHVIAAA